MKPDKYRERTVDELQDDAAKLKEQIFRLRFQFAMGQTENPLRIRHARKDLARVKTIINEKQRAQRGATEGRS